VDGVSAHPAPTPEARRVLFLVTEDWYFCSHRLPIARALKQAGFEVAIACRVDRHGPMIEAEGFRLFPIALSRRSLNPFHLIAAIGRIRRVLRDFRPDVIHNVALKPAVLGSLAARLERVPACINAIAGLGFVFSSARMKARLLRPVLTLALRMLLRPSHVIVQNDDDGRTLTARGIVAPERVTVICGSGVDLARFQPAPEPEGPVCALMVSRMIVEKGVRDLAAAARLLKSRGTEMRILMAGRPDAENPSAIAVSELERWAREGIIEYLGHVDDVAALWHRAHIGVLPSYYAEGVPLALIEAAAAGRPLIACAGPGLSDIAVADVSALIVPARDPEALAAALAQLAGDGALRARLGTGARRLAEERFSAERVVAETLALYRHIGSFQSMPGCIE
jgi:glycosyltransferase involved in cell wall biosynthesis